MFVDCSLYNKKELQLVSVSYNRTGCIRILTTIRSSMKPKPYVTQIPGIIYNTLFKNALNCMCYIIVFNAKVYGHSELSLGMEVDPGSR